eukprot:3435150-Rhodomonas_salina.1
MGDVDLKRVESGGRASADMRRSGDMRRGRSSLDVVRRISAEVSRAMHPAQQHEADTYAGLAQAARRMSVEVSRVSMDAKRRGRSSQEREIMGPVAEGKPVQLPGGDLVESPDEEPFVPSHGLTSAEAATLLEKWGRNEL